VADRRPNIVFVMADDHAAHALGAYGSRIGLDQPGSGDESRPEEWELFDLVDEPWELTNRYGEPGSSPLVAELRAELDRLGRVGDVDPAEDPRRNRMPARGAT
jgi:hypothetical protein